ncbi:hypothetical protein NQ176_g2388 [Zarea fungicola]|uniref:Uncharacterized protein n=1 Tax=Zarea fungicola TaxID=93591 RepID=A0ACC1NR81_9HYPO|nr:hypothetical protein NQ176_g2388 [Lecanicillium fungicola]
MRVATVLSLFAAVAIASPAPEAEAEDSAAATSKCGTLNCQGLIDLMKQINKLMTDEATKGRQETDADAKMSDQLLLTFFRAQAQTYRKCAVAKCKKVKKANEVPRIRKVDDICKKGDNGKYDCTL